MEDDKIFNIFGAYAGLKALKNTSGKIPVSMIKDSIIKLTISLMFASSKYVESVVSQIQR